MRVRECASERVCVCARESVDGWPWSRKRIPGDDEIER